MPELTTQLTVKVRYDVGITNLTAIGGAKAMIESAVLNCEGLELEHFDYIAEPAGLDAGTIVVDVVGL